MNPQYAKYVEFLKDKVQLGHSTGLTVGEMHPSLFPHQRDIITWALKRGKALIAAKFGLGKSRMQIEILRQVHQQTGRKVMVICPLGVKHQFIHEDGPAMGVKFAYIGNDEDGLNADTPYLITNYERVRDGQISEAFLQSEIAGVCLDEGAILGNLGTKTQQEFSRILSEIPYRWVATATPAPNDYRQLIYFADFLDAMDAGQSLTRFFGRNPDKAGDLVLLEHMERDFWLWIASWCIFVDVPSDLGYDDTGYDMPELNITFHRISADHEAAQGLTDQFGQHYLLADTAAGVQQAMKEKRTSLQPRIDKVIQTVKEIINGQGEDESIQQGLLRSKQGRRKEAQTRILSSEQGEDRQGESEDLHEGISEDLQKTEENTGRASGDQSKKAGTLRERSRVSGTRQGDVAQQSITQASSQTSLSPEVSIWIDAQGLQRNPEEAGRGMCDLWDETDERNDSQGEDREEAICRPQSRNGGSEGDSLPSLQLRPGSIQGRSEPSVQSDRLPQRQIVIWCDLNDEQKAIEKGMKSLGVSYSSIYGSLSHDEAENRLYDWLEKRTRVLISKASILGSGVNMQQSHRAIYAGVGFKFRDFIQSIHRLQRYGQMHTVQVDVVHTDAEDHVVDILMGKWKQHDEMVAKMREIIREYGLTNEALGAQMRRSLGIERQQKQGTWYTSINNDCVAETMTMEDNSVDEIVTSVPFGNHYEYVASLNDFGHNQLDSDFWLQMDFLIPELLRVLKPGRMACIHVKDRLLYGHQTPHGMMEVDYFSHDCARAFRKHGFVAYGEIFIPTDVVRENNSTNRLGWSECCKDGSKMGVGLSEKVLLFRKPQTDKSRSYADEPVRKDKKEYARGRWQLDAHSLWRSNGIGVEDVPQSSPAEDPDLLIGMDGSQVYNWYKAWSQGAPYDYHQHVAFNEAMGDRLPAKFMLMPPQAPDEYEETVWTDVLFMRTLNMSQARRRVEKHVCPFPLDIVERLIVRYSNPDDLVYDPFAGLHTVPYMAIKLGRRGLGCELNSLYWSSGVKYCEDAEIERATPTLFDFAEMEQEVA